VRDASGVVIGRLDGNGNVVNSAGQIIVRGVQGTAGSIGTGSSSTTTTTGSSGGTNSRLLNRAVQGTSGSGSVLGSGSSSSTGGISAGDFQVRADGTVTLMRGFYLNRAMALVVN